jgi:hypothetical protein
VGIAYNTGPISLNGLKFYADPANSSKMGASPYEELTGSTTVTNTDFTEVDGVWRSNADPVTGAGTSNLSFSGISVATGSFTMIIWLKVTSNPNVGTNNNWRSVLLNGGSSQNPFGILMEQNTAIQFTLSTTVTTYRFLGGLFTQFSCTQDQWFQVVFAYDAASGTGFAYSNGVIVRSGKMSTAADQLTFAQPGEGANPITTGLTYRISNNNGANPSGAGCFPGDIGPAMIYDRALTATEVQQNFNAIRGRYGI